MRYRESTTLVRTATGEMVEPAREAFACAVYDAVYDAVRPLAKMIQDGTPPAGGVEDFCTYFASAAYKAALRKA